MIATLATLHVLTVAALSLFGLLGLFTLAVYWQHRDVRYPAPAVQTAVLPPVTVQLPIYNEKLVVERLILAAAYIDYPKHLLQIQVVDDSDDETVQKAAVLVQQLQDEGLNVQHVRRPKRVGYKAGALEYATQSATGDFIAIFDADFLPQPSFLRQTIPHFLANPKLGMVQTRWAHLNDLESSFTGAQGIILDKHFALEQTVSYRAQMYPKFNGSGGVWRKTAVRQAGGWEHDTVCEDLCLSVRALLRGWEFRFLDEVTSPAELPAHIAAYKNQQARWAKGATQCLYKYGAEIAKDGRQSLTARLYGLISMAGYMAHPLLLILLILQLPILLLDVQFSSFMLLFSVAGIGQPLLFILGQRLLHRDWGKRLRNFPALLLIAIGTAPNNSRAIWQATFGSHHPFIRTPKRGTTANAPTYRLPFDKIIFAELACALYALLGVAIALSQQQYGSLFFLSTCFLGMSYVVLLSLRKA